MTKTEHSEKVKECGELAGRYFKQGYCCSEAILKATMDIYSPETKQDNILRLASGFCGGMGDTGGPCGVFSGGIMALGHFVGRNRHTDSDRMSRKLSRIYTERLGKNANGMVCREILEGMRFTNWNKRGCRKLTEAGAEILAGIIEEYGIAGTK